MLSFLIFVPLIGSIIILPFNDETSQQQSLVKKIALFISIVTFILTIIIWILFDNSASGYQFIQNWESELSFLHINLGIDSLSLYFVLLTGLLTPVCILASWNNVSYSIKQFIVAQLIIEGLLISVFLVQDLLLFYISFESVLVPLFLVVGIWGGSPTRVRSAYLLFLYTLAGSLFILLAIITIYAHTGTTDMITLILIDISPESQRLLWLAFFIALAVKTPLVPFHIWLPRAHADAPLAGSIVLAGTVLKLATYGYLRIVIPILPDATSYFTPLIQTIAIISLIYSSLATLRQVDFKALVAYSSVSHMAIVVLGIFSNSIIGIQGAILLSLAHGLVSPALFILVGGVLYDRFHTRTIQYYRGIGQFIPVFSLLFLIATMCNMGVPLSLNWISELIALIGVFEQSPIIGVLGATGIVFSACYSIWMWSRIVGGSYSRYLTYTIDMNRREFIVVITLLVPTIYLGINPNIIISSLHVFVTNILYFNLFVPYNPPPSSCTISPPTTPSLSLILYFIRWGRRVTNVTVLPLFSDAINGTGKEGEGEVWGGWWGRGYLWKRERK